MSDGAENIRKDILKLARQSASTNYDPDSLQNTDDNRDYRIRFLECRKQFEQSPPPPDKKPFYPYWIKPDNDTDIPVTYKKRGIHITDVKIDFMGNEARNNKYIDSYEVFRAPTSNNAVPNSLNRNVMQTSDERLNRLIERHGRSIKTRCSQSLKVMVDKSTSRIVDHIIDLHHTSNSPYLSMSPKLNIQPMVRKAIELKKYDHIISNVIPGSMTE